MTPIRIGLLGAARIAPNALIKPSRRVPDVEIAAIAARDRSRARRFAYRHGIPKVHDSYAALLDDPTIDAIYNPLPNSHHAEWSIHALEAGKHVLCEKPIASNQTEAEEMQRAADGSGLVLMEAFHNLYYPAIRELRQIVQRGQLGKIHHAEASFCSPLLRFKDIRYQYKLAGGATMDLGCYPISLLRYLLDVEPQVLNAQATLMKPQVDRTMEIDLEFPATETHIRSGCHGRVICSFLSPRLVRIGLKIVGEHGSIQMINPVVPHYFHQVHVVVDGKSERKQCGILTESTYLHQLRAFVRAVRGEVYPAIDLRFSIGNMQIIDEVYQRAGLWMRGMTCMG